MVPIRFWLVILSFWLLELLFLPWMGVVWIVVDPLLLLLFFLGFQLPTGRFLWVYGVSIGFLRDLVTGSLFGGFVCTFGLVGWILGSSRHLVEREDPLLQGIWAGILTGVSGLTYGLLIILADPAVGWNRWWWGVFPVAVAVHGICAAWSFPRLQRFLRIPAYGR